MSALGFLQTGLAVVLMVGTLVLVHEAGHFVVARLFGVTVKVFSIGVGPRAFGFTWGKTDYRVSWIPIGGYVRWVGADPFSDSGSDDDPDWIDAKGSFIHKPAWQRLLIVAAGPVTNLVLPVLVFTGLFLWGEPQWTATVGYVVPDSAAERGGLHPGDRLVRIGEVEVDTWNDVSDALDALPPADALALVYARDGQQHRVQLPLQGVEDPHHFGDYGLDPRAIDTTLLVDDPASPVGKAGLRTGDRVRRVNGAPVETWAQMLRALGGQERARLEVDRVVDDATESLTVEVAVDPTWAPPRYPADDDTWARWGLVNGMLGIAAIQHTLPDGTASPAQCQGLRLGDRVLRIGERDVRRWVDITAAITASFPAGGTLTDAAAALPFVLRRDGQIVELTITPAVVQEVDQTRRYKVGPRVGFGPGGAYVYPSDTIRSYAAPQAAERALSATVGSAGRMIEQLGLIFTGGAPASQNVGGPIEIFSTAADAWSRGLFESAATVALLSISLGVLNLLPVPVLDGGQIVMYLAEWVRGRPLPWRLRERLQQVGVLMLLSVLLLVSAWDISRRVLPESAPPPGKCA